VTTFENTTATPPHTFTNALHRSDGMNIEELRNAIWNHLFRAGTAKSVDELAALVALDPTHVREAVSHEWFSVNDNRVSIAYATPAQNY
jgi:hypothetical protein